MQEHDDNGEALTPTENTINGSKLKVWERRIEIIVLIAASIGLLVCAGLLIQAYFTQKPAFKIVDDSFFKPGFELLVYYSFLFLSAGFLASIISSDIYTIFERRTKKISYILAVIATIFIFLSFGLFFISYKPEQEWWGYFSMVALGTNIIITNFQKIINLKQKYFSNILEFTSFVLLLASFILSFLAIRDNYY